MLIQYCCVLLKIISKVSRTESGISHWWLCSTLCKINAYNVNIGQTGVHNRRQPKTEDGNWFTITLFVRNVRKKQWILLRVNLGLELKKKVIQKCWYYILNILIVNGFSSHLNYLRDVESMLTATERYNYPGAKLVS